MKKLASLIFIILISTSIFTSIYAIKKVTATGNAFDANGVFDVRANLPKNTNGENGVNLQYLSNGVYQDLQYYVDYAFSFQFPNSPFRIPVISGYFPYGVSNPPLSTDTITAHPSAIVQCQGEADPVIRVTVPGDGGEVRVTGTAGVQMGSVRFYIYKGADQYNSPIWSANNGGSFDFIVEYKAGDQIFFVDDADANDVNDWAYCAVLNNLNTSSVQNA